MSQFIAPLLPQAANPGPCNIRYTPHQVALANSAGMDTSQWRLDADFSAAAGTRGSNIFADSWSNPPGFGAPHLRVPYRFKTVNYDSAQMDNMRLWLNEMSGYIEGCIEFYDDTETEHYSRDYILIRNTDEQDEYDGGCWSSLGYSHPAVYQSMNMGYGCIVRSIMQHEMLHALGFLHEQQRPDRDGFVDILYDNIQPQYQFAFDKMDVEAWENYDQIYDLMSVMHYEGTAFRTEEALAAGNSSIVYKGTMERVRINAPALSSIDVVQLTKRYNDFCTEPTDKIACSENDQDGYYLSWKVCNGYNDCLNGSDEGFDRCGDLGCGQSLFVSGLDSIEGSYLWIDTGHTNAKPAYFNSMKDMYLYVAPNGNWHFGSELGAGFATAWTAGHDCPSNQEYQASGENGWEVFPEISVSCRDCPTTTDPVTTVPPTLPPNAQWCSPGWGEAGFFYDYEECDMVLHCDNGQDETWAKCGDGGCGQAFEVVGAGDLNGHYLIRYSDGFHNGKPYYERVEPSSMFLFSSSLNDNWHFETTLGSQWALGWAPPTSCATTGPYRLWDKTEQQWSVVDDFRVNCLDCVDFTIPVTCELTNTRLIIVFCRLYTFSLKPLKSKNSELRQGFLGL